MTDKELFKLALDALEWSKPHEDAVITHTEAITALKERLAQEKALQALHNENERLGLYKDAYAEQEQQPVAWAMDYDIESVLSGFSTSLMGTAMRIESAFPKHRVKLLYTTPPQRTEQEPVAWKWRVKDFCDWPNWSVSLKRPADSGHAQYPRTKGYEDIPLYTHPPQRTWVGLTDEEIAEGIKQSWVTEQAFQSAAWWAEAKLKEKNT